MEGLFYYRMAVQPAAARGILDSPPGFFSHNHNVRPIHELERLVLIRDRVMSKD